MIIACFLTETFLSHVSLEVKISLRDVTEYILYYSCLNKIELLNWIEIDRDLLE